MSSGPNGRAPVNKVLVLPKDVYVYMYIHVHIPLYAHGRIGEI